ncbi:MAG: 3-oxoacyl-ACP reductase FabG [Nitrososphaerota archaeon]|nr:3-oxoacyl-ACP reductase FabG [Nitrososphaerota archaeon]
MPEQEGSRRRVALVTGGSGGIGRGIAERFASAGVDVALGDIRDDVAGLAGQIRAAGGARVVGLRVDVSDYSSCAKFYSSATELFRADHVDILVNNAGINRDSLFVKMTPEQWDQVIKVDLYSMFNCTKQVVDGMIAHGGGRIINISSMSWLGNVGQANYAAAKAGVIGFTKTLAKELARYNITVNAICPGFVDTPMTRAVPDRIRQKFLERIPMGRIGTPADVANFAFLLASGDASYVTGEVVNVSGGLVM